MRLAFDPIVAPVVLIAVAVFLVALGTYEAIAIKRAGKARRVLSVVSSVLIAVSLVAIGMRPYVLGERQEVQATTKNLDIVFCIDSTLSMWACDEGGTSRLEAALADAHAIMEAAPGCCVSVISFDNFAKQIVPFTNDTESIEDAIAGISQPSEYWSFGTDMSQPIEELDSMLESRDGEKPMRPCLVFFMSDGEETSDDGSLAKSWLSSGVSQYVDGGMVLGYGSEAGTQIVVEESGEFVRDYSTSSPATTRIDEESLKRVASELGVEYAKRSNDGSEAAIQQARSTWNLAGSDAYNMRVSTRLELYGILAIPLAAGFAIWLAIAVRNLMVALRAVKPAKADAKPKADARDGGERR